MYAFTKNGLSALQFVSVSPSAEAIDEVTQLIHMLQLPGHYHLFTHQVGLWQVCSSLQTQPTFTCLNTRLELCCKAFPVDNLDFISGHCSNV